MQVTAEPASGASVRGELAKLGRDSSQYLVGLLGSMALGFISFPIFTRALSMADYGSIDLVQKVVLIVTAIAKLGLQNSALRLYDGKAFAQNPDDARRYYSTLFVGTVAPAFLAAALFGAALALLPLRSAEAGLTSALLVSIVLVPPRSIQSLLWSFLRVEERTKTFNIVTVAMKAATIAAVCLLISWRPPSAAIYFGATAAVEAIFVIALTAPLLRSGMIRLSRFDGALFRGACAFGFPLVLNEVAFVVLDAGDRFLVRRFLGSEPLGVYAVACGLASLLYTLITTPLNLAVVPMYMRLWNAGEREKTVRFLSAGMDFLLLASGCLFVVVAAGSRDLVVLAASSKYLAAAELIPPIFTGLLLFSTYVFVSAGFMVERKTGRIATLMAAGAACKIALNCVLLPSLGLFGAALATAISYIFCIVLMAYFAFRLLPLQIYWRRVFSYGLASASGWGVAASVHTSTAVGNLLVKSALGCVVYAAVICLLDNRPRRWLARRLTSAEHSIA